MTNRVLMQFSLMRHAVIQKKYNRLNTNVPECVHYILFLSLITGLSFFRKHFSPHYNPTRSVYTHGYSNVFTRYFFFLLLSTLISMITDDCATDVLGLGKMTTTKINVFFYHNYYHYCEKPLDWITTRIKKHVQNTKTFMIKR